MIIKQYIKDFEKLGFGMFVHYGLYSVLGKGEWAKLSFQMSDDAYFSLCKQFQPEPDWVTKLL